VSAASCCHPSGFVQHFEPHAFAHDIPECEYTPRVHEAMTAMTMELHALRQRLDELEKAADLDPLLPVLSRRAFMRALRRQISAIGRYKTRTSLIYIDLDGFKTINDTFGHACGDATLRHFAGMLLRNMRGSDLIGRLGGDEFGVIMSHANPDQARVKAEMISEKLRASPASWNGLSISIAYSFGALDLRSDDDADSAIARADAAMYAQKRLRLQAGRTDPANI
jgi:diguanylate cyclase (GGDEF)-like protein